MKFNFISFALTTPPPAQHIKSFRAALEMPQELRVDLRLNAKRKQKQKLKKVTIKTCTIKKSCSLSHFDSLLELLAACLPVLLQTEFAFYCCRRCDELRGIPGGACNSYFICMQFCNFGFDCLLTLFLLCQIIRFVLHS